MSGSSGSFGVSPFAEEPELTEAERDSIGPLAEWVLNLVRAAEGAVSNEGSELQSSWARGI